MRGVQALEGGDSRPRRDTLRRLVDALALGEEDRARLLAAGAPVPRLLPSSTGGMADLVAVGANVASLDACYHDVGE